MRGRPTTGEFAMTFREIAEALGDKEENVKQICHYALRKLRRERSAVKRLKELRAALIEAREEKEAV